MILKSRLSRDSKIALWQFCFVLFGTSWLLAPALNSHLIARTSLISQYETGSQPYSWLFRICDALAAILVLLAVYTMRRQSIYRKELLAIAVIGTLILVDPIITTTCVQVGKTCVESPGLKFYIHGAESIIVALVIFGLSVYDMLKNKALTSTMYVAFQVLYGFLFASRLASTYHFSTLSQYVYQLLTVFWIAWFVGGLLARGGNSSKRDVTITRRVFAIWAYMNGAIAIVLSLVHIHLFGFIHSVYFAGNTAWLGQHGVVVGVAMLYISWHLWRGEHRARQLFLGLLFIEMLKYSVISPNIKLTIFYSLSFFTLFVAKNAFTRGSVALSWHRRIQEAEMLLLGVIGSLGLAVLIVINNRRYLSEVRESATELNNAVPYHGVIHHVVPRNLLIHTVTALIISTLYFVLWSLFRPAKQRNYLTSPEDKSRVEELLAKYSNSSEDYFKLWPNDKQYFWLEDNNGFIAYKISKSVVFALADPVAESTSKREELLEVFLSNWKARGYKICFLIVDELSKAMYKDAGMNVIQIGASAVIDIQKFANVTLRDKWWRWQINRGNKAGYNYEVSYPPHSSGLLLQLKNVSDLWITRQGHREQGFALGSFNDNYLQSCTVHYIKDSHSKVVAFTNQLPIFNEQAQTTVDLMRFLPEQNNSMPFLLSQMILNLQTEGMYSHFDLGFVPLAKMDSKFASIAKVIGSQRFSASGLERFKNKFDPEWRRCYIAYDGSVADVAAIALSVEEAMKP